MPPLPRAGRVRGSRGRLKSSGASPGSRPAYSAPGPAVIPTTWADWALTPPRRMRRAERPQGRGRGRSRPAATRGLPGRRGPPTATGSSAPFALQPRHWSRPEYRPAAALRRRPCAIDRSGPVPFPLSPPQGLLSVCHSRPVAEAPEGRPRRIGGRVAAGVTMRTDEPRQRAARLDPLGDRARRAWQWVFDRGPRARLMAAAAGLTVLVAVGYYAANAPSESVETTWLFDGPPLPPDDARRILSALAVAKIPASPAARGQIAVSAARKGGSAGRRRQAEARAQDDPRDPGRGRERLDVRRPGRPRRPARPAPRGRGRAHHRPLRGDRAGRGRHPPLDGPRAGLSRGQARGERLRPDEGRPAALAAEPPGDPLGPAERRARPAARRPDGARPVGPALRRPRQPRGERGDDGARPRGGASRQAPPGSRLDRRRPRPGQPRPARPGRGRPGLRRRPGRGAERPGRRRGVSFARPEGPAGREGPHPGAGAARLLPPGFPAQEPPRGEPRRAAILRGEGRGVDPGHRPERHPGRRAGQPEDRPDRGGRPRASPRGLGRVGRVPAARVARPGRFGRRRGPAGPGPDRDPLDGRPPTVGPSGDRAPRAHFRSDRRRRAVGPRA